MGNILYFAEAANIAGVHINMDTSKEKAINVHIKDGRITHFKLCEEGLFYINLNDPIMTTNHTNVSLNTYYYLSTVKQNLDLLIILRLKERRNFEIYRNNCTGLVRQRLKLIYDHE